MSGDGEGGMKKSAGTWVVVKAFSNSKHKRGMAERHKKQHGKQQVVHSGYGFLFERDWAGKCHLLGH
jgi:hypothetical protein